MTLVKYYVSREMKSMIKMESFAKVAPAKFNFIQLFGIKEIYRK